jgi:hypothetical protein
MVYGGEIIYTVEEPPWALLAESADGWRRKTRFGVMQFVSTTESVAQQLSQSVLTPRFNFAPADSEQKDGTVRIFFSFQTIMSLLFASLLMVLILTLMLQHVDPWQTI